MLKQTRERICLLRSRHVTASHAKKIGKSKSISRGNSKKERWSSRYISAKIRDTIARRQHRLNPSIKDCRLRFSFEWTASSENAIKNHSSNRRTILRLPDEVLLSLFRLSRFIPTTICLALTCKRLCSLYLETLNHRSAKEENRLWNSTNGFWKYQLIENLSHGWISKEVVRFCWGCWLFRLYGETSRDFWRAKVPALSATATRKISNALGGQCSSLPAVAHSSEDCLSSFPKITQLSDGVRGITDILQRHVDGAPAFKLEKRLCDADDLQQYQINWEVRFWLGERGITGVNTSLAKDQRIRCPACVLTNNPLRLLDRGMKIVRPDGQPDLALLLGKTLARRASLLGYKWDPRRRVYSVTKTERSVTGI